MFVRGSVTKFSRRRAVVGLTTIELMTVIAVTGVLSLAIMGVLREAGSNAHHVKLQTELNRELEVFAYTLEQYLGQTVQLIDCNCTAAANGCRNDSLDVTLTPDGDILEFVYENASDPKTLPGSGCLFNGAGTTPIGTSAVSEVVPLGCKRVMKLRYTRPTPTTVSAASTPGKLELVWTQPSAAAGATGTVVATLNNVTNFACGMTADTVNSQMSNSDIKLRIDVKSRVNNTNNINDPNYETWSDNAADTKLSTFNKGYRRTHLNQIYFRNITTPGLQFGKLRQVKNCIADNQASTDVMKCCSGYRDPLANICVASSSCTPPGDPAPGGVAEQCCSKMRDSTLGTCL